jgi:acyl-CoA thioester hydrolase
MDRSKFKHKTSINVRNYEVDWQGIVHNANYLLYCEVGRIEYLKDLGAKVNMQSINGDSRVVLVRNEIDYKSPASFDQLLNVYTRTSSIRNTSFAMESMIEKRSDRRIGCHECSVSCLAGSGLRYSNDSRNRISQIDTSIRRQGL